MTAVDNETFIGPITGFEESGDSKTGYRVSFYVEGIEKTYDAVKEVYDIQFSDDFFPYPVLGELLFQAILDQDGVIEKLINCTGVENPDNPIKSCFVMGQMRMFQNKLTEDAPRAADILSIKDNLVTFTNYEKYIESGQIHFSVSTGAMPDPANGVSFKIAPDIKVYTWDWTTSLVPFGKCTREEAVERQYRERFELGSLDDIMKNCFWVGFYSTRGDEEICDLVKCFLNEVPGWE